MRSAAKLAVTTAAGLWVLVAPAQPAAGQTASASDPAPGSPAGTQYQLPLDAARGDAAPVRGDGGAGGTGQSATAPDGTGRSATAPIGADQGATAPSGNGEEGARAAPSVSAIRSENGFGSSSVVPGYGDAGGADPGGDDAAGRNGKRADEPREAPAIQAADITRGVASDPSGLRVYGLLALSVVLAVAVAAAARTRPRA